MDRFRFRGNRFSTTLRSHPLRCNRRRFLRHSAASVIWLAAGCYVRAAEPDVPSPDGPQSPGTPAAATLLPPMTGDDVPGLESFDAFMRGFLVEHHLPGAALAISHGNRLIYARGFGRADREAREPVGPTSLFRIASVTKPFTSAVVMQLVEGGKLHLDDRIWTVLDLSAPRWNGAQFDPRWKEITVHELLQHRGGWDRDKSFDPIGRMRDITQKIGVELPVGPHEILRYMLGFPLDFPPGERYAYSNFGYILLGLLIERITGRRYEEVVRKDVLLPLGIRQMRLGHALVEQRAKGEVKYYDSKGRVGSAVFGPHIGQIVPLPYGAENFEAYAAHGGWIASAPELVRFAAALDDPAHCPIMSANSIATTFARPAGLAGHDADGQPKKSYYGCGWLVRPVGSKGKFNFWHNGLISGTSTLVVGRFDHLHWAVLFNTNANPAGQPPAALIDPLLHGVANKITRWPEREISVAE